MDEACSAVEVVDRCLYVDFSFVTLKTCRLESNFFALYIGVVEMESHASSFKNESCRIRKIRSPAENMVVKLIVTMSIITGGVL